MPRLQTKKSRLAAHKPGRVSAFTPLETKRMTGRKLQDRRLRLWTKSPSCAMCGKFTLYPNGFDLDHTKPLHQGGEDTDENCQVLCNGPDGCHDRKTRIDGGFRKRW